MCSLRTCNIHTLGTIISLPTVVFSETSVLHYVWWTHCHFELLKSLWSYVVTYLCVGQPGAPPPPPPPGSMPGATTLSKSYTSRVRLPMLNWTVAKNITKTVFEELNDKRIVSTLNFREFETLFEARKQSTFEKPGEALHLKLIPSVYS